GPAFAIVTLYVSVAPAATGLGDAVIETDRSALDCTVVVVVAVLLPGVGSGVGEATEIEFVTVPALVGAVIAIESGAEPPDAIAACVHVTAPPLTVQVQPLPLAPEKVEPAGIGSVTVTVPDGSGPALLTLTEYVMVPPGATGFGAPVTLTERSDEPPPAPRV